MTSNVAGALAYLLGFVSGIICLVVEPYKSDPFVRFHAFQPIFLSALYVAFSILWGALFGALALGRPGVFWSLVTLVWSLVRLVFLLAWFFMMYKAYNNERYSLPIIGPLAAKQAAG
jgi:uncharacterized membrane protein